MSALIGCESEPELNSTPTECEPINFVPSPEGAALPVGYVENGQYLFVNGAPRSKACIRERVCQANGWTRQHANQSYYIRLDSVGGTEIARQFPSVVEEIKEGSDDREWHLYLDKFCIATECAAAFGRIQPLDWSEVEWPLLTQSRHARVNK